MKINPIGPEVAHYIATHQDAYPEAMREDDVEMWHKMLASTPYSIGVFAPDYGAQALVSWYIFQRESPGVIYGYDLTVLPQFQGRGLAKTLVRASMKLPRWHGETIHCHLRSTSYNIVADPRVLWECGYEIVADVFRPDHYWEVYDHAIHEDAHELWVKPIGMRINLQPGTR